MIPGMIIMRRARRRRRMPPRPAPRGYRVIVPIVPLVLRGCAMMPPPGMNRNGDKKPPYPIPGRGCFMMPPVNREDDGFDEYEDDEEDV